MKKIIVLGAGFAGLNVVRALKNIQAEILVIDKLNYHQFQPLFYQVATSRLESSSISFPLRKHFQKYNNVSYRLAEAQEIDSNNKILITDIGSFPYDELIIATGCTTNFFGNKQIQENAYPMKSIPEALNLRNKILLTFEKTLSATEEERNSLMNIVIVGGGPTGVELAGALIELKKNILPKDYPDMDFSKLKIYLLEGGKNLLAPMSDASHKMSRKYLEEMGVIVMTEAVVKNYDGNIISLGDGSIIQSKQLIWAAGVTGNMLKGIAPENIARGNRIKVDRFMRVLEMEHIYAIGDIAYMETPKYPNAHPQVATVAIEQGKLLGKNLKLKDTNKKKEFEYKDKGSMATIGKRKAVVDLPKFSFQGRLAWFFWMFLHLMLILSVRNKLIVFLNWMISYFTNDTSLRLIIRGKKE